MRSPTATSTIGRHWTRSARPTSASPATTTGSTDLSPGGLRGPGRAGPSAPSPSCARSRRPTRPSGSPRRRCRSGSALALDMYDAGETTSELSVITSGAARGPRRLRPDADRRRGRRSSHIAARLAAVPTALRRSRADPARGGRRRPRRSRATRSSRWPSSATSGSTADGDNFWPGLVQRVGRGARPARLAARRPGAGRGGGPDGDRRLRAVPARRAGPARAGQGGRRARAVPARLALLPRRHDRPRRDVRLGLRRAGPASRPRCAAVADKIVAGRHGRRGGRRARRRPGPHASQGKEAFRDWMQELADRAIAELHGTHFDIPEQVRRIECCLAPDHRTAASTTPARARTSPGRAGCGGPCRRASTASPPGGR